MKHLFLLFFVFFFNLSIKGQTVNEVIHMVEKLNRSLYEKGNMQYSDEQVSNLIARLEKCLFYLDEAAKGFMDKDDMISSELLRYSLEHRIFLLKWRSHLMPLNAEGGFLNVIVFTLRGMNTETERRTKSYMRYLNKIPSIIDQKILLMKEGQELGISSPKIVVEKCLDLVNETLDQKIDSSYFFSPALGSKVEEEAREIIKKQVRKSYKKLKRYLEGKYMDGAPAEVGISALETGKEFYEESVRYFTTEDITPDEVFEIGMSEVNRIKSEMMEILKELNFEGTYQEFLEFLRTDPQFYAKDAVEILGHATRIKEEMEGKMDLFFNRIQKSELVVKPVPLSIALNYTAGRYSRGSYSENRPGEYWVNTTKLESRPLYTLPALSLHEGVPGHHTQIMLNSEINKESMRPKIYLSAFGEGWALYCEYLGEEAGMYHTPYERFGRLTYEMWRACRLVVDPGMHYKGWTREEAFNFMKENTALSIHEINTEINRYIGWPGQAVSYKMGELKIKELRKKSETILGERFDLKVFHDKVLENGSILMSQLEDVINEWINEEGMQ